MVEQKGILCEILFVDSKSGKHTSIVGRVEEYQLSKFNTDLNNFISFIESYNPPVLKDDIEEIITYDDEDGMTYYVEQGKLRISEIESSITKAEIS